MIIVLITGLVFLVGYCLARLRRLKKALESSEKKLAGESITNVAYPIVFVYSLGLIALIIGSPG